MTMTLQTSAMPADNNGFAAAPVSTVTDPLPAPRIAVVGIGGGGCNALDNMIKGQLEGVEFLALNTDAQALARSQCDHKIQLGPVATHGLGAGALPELGKAAAEEVLAQITESLAGLNMVFIAAGMGGGTGTGAAPVIASATRAAGILTVGVVTKPFDFEGRRRMAAAEEGIAALQACVDTLIVVPNQKLFRVASHSTTLSEAFRMADDVLYGGVRSVTDLSLKPGMINLDFADVRAIMTISGRAMIGTGEAEGPERAIAAAEAAIASELLDDARLPAARGLLINITGGADLTLFEVDAAASRIRDAVDPSANIIFGSTLDPDMDGLVRVSLVATGISPPAEEREPAQRVEAGELETSESALPASIPPLDAEDPAAAEYNIAFGQPAGQSDEQ